MFRLKELRKQKGMLLKELSQEIGIPLSTYAGYEREEREPKLEVWIKMAKYFNVDVAYLQGISDVKKSQTLAELEMLQGDENVLKSYFAVIATNDDQQTLCGAFECVDDAKVRWWDVINLLEYEDAEIKSVPENEITKFKNFEVRFPKSSFGLERED